MKQNLNELAARIHKQNAQWWTDLVTGKPIERNKGELLMLAITELSEMVEGIRKNLPDDKIVTRSMEEVEAADFWIRILDYVHGFNLGNLELPKISLLDLTPENKAEAILVIAQSVMRIYDASGTIYEAHAITVPLALMEAYCVKHSLDLEGAMEEKLEYNKTRRDHQREARLLADGKKF